MNKEQLALEITKLYFSKRFPDDDIIAFAEKFISHYQKVLNSMI